MASKAVKSGVNTTARARMKMPKGMPSGGKKMTKGYKGPMMGPHKKG